MTTETARNTITEAAHRHAKDTGEYQHEIGDLHEALTVALDHLSPEELLDVLQILKDEYSHDLKYDEPTTDFWESQ